MYTDAPNKRCFSWSNDALSAVENEAMFEIRDLTKKRCGIRDLPAPGNRDLPNLGTGCGIAIKKESGMRNFHKKGMGMRDQDPADRPGDATKRAIFWGKIIVPENNTL